MLNTDEMTLAYELDWLRLKEIQEDNDNDEVFFNTRSVTSFDQNNNLIRNVENFPFEYFEWFYL